MLIAPGGPAFFGGRESLRAFTAGRPCLPPSGMPFDGSSNDEHLAWQYGQWQEESTPTSSHLEPPGSEPARMCANVGRGGGPRPFTRPPGVPRALANPLILLEPYPSTEHGAEVGGPPGRGRRTTGQRSADHRAEVGGPPGRGRRTTGQRSADHRAEVGGPPGRGRRTTGQRSASTWERSADHGGEVGGPPGRGRRTTGQRSASTWERSADHRAEVGGPRGRGRRTTGERSADHGGEVGGLRGRGRRSRRPHRAIGSYPPSEPAREGARSGARPRAEPGHSLSQARQVRG